MTYPTYHVAVEPAHNGLYPRVMTCPADEGEIWCGNVDHPSNSRFHYYLAWTGHILLVGIQYIGAYHFSAPVTWLYAYEKFRLRSDRDAKCVADFLNDQISPGQKATIHQ